MADDVLQSFFVAIGWKVDAPSQVVAKKSVADYEQAVTKAEKAIEDARWAGAKTEEEVARLTRETNLKLAKEALERAKAEDRQRVEADKKQDAALKAARARIGDFVKVAVGMGAAIEAAALGVHAGVVKMAQGFDTLNFTSQRTGVTVRNIQAIGYAASQMGSTVEAGVGSLESFARTLRQSPGSYSLLERLGIKTTDAKGARRSADALFQEFGKALKDKPGYLQDAYLQDFGIDEKTGRALIQGLDKFTEEYNDKLRKTGLDPDKAAKDASALQRTFGSLAASISIIGQKVASNLFSGENNAFQKFIDFLDAHGDQIAEVISHIAQVVLELARALLELVTSPEAKKWFDALMLAFGDFDKETGKFTANTEKMKVALGIFGTFVATTWLAKILGAFGALGAGWKGLLGILGLGAGATGALAVGTAVGADASVPNDLKPGASDQWDEDHAGAAPGGSVGAATGLAKRAWGAVKRGAAAVGHALGGGSADATDAAGVGIRARGHRASRGDQSGGVAANPGAYKDVLDHIARSEGTANRSGGGYSTSLANGLLLPEGKEQDLTSKTLDEIDALQTGMLRHPANRWNSSAIGRYQIVRTTLRDQREKLGLKGSDLFDAQVQDRIGANLARQRGADPVGLREEWASLVGAKNATAVALMQKVDPKASTMPLPQSPVPGSGRQITGLDGQVGMDLGNGTMRMPSGAIRSITANASTAAPASISSSASTNKPVTIKDILPNGIPGVFNGSLPAFASPSAPAPSTDNSKTIHVSIKQGDTHVRGVEDPKRAADHIGTVAGYRNSDLVRNLRSSLA